MLAADWTGRRVVVRRVSRSHDGAPTRYADVLGDLLTLGPSELEIETRAGRVVVPRGEVVSARLVLPAAAQVLALEGVSARGWRAREVQTSPDGWVLRADRGWTGRANSALPLRTVRRPLDEVLADVTAWYATRGLPARIQIPEPAATALGHALGRRGWTAADHTDVLVGRLDLLAGRLDLLAGRPDVLTGRLGAPAGAADVTLAPRPDDDWLAAYHYRGGDRLPDGAGDLLARHDRAVFARVERDGLVVAIGRGAVDDGWLGITAVDVGATHRRRGLAAAVVGRLGRWGAASGAVRAYAQSDRTNDPAHRLFEGLGFHVHHSYLYRSAPTIEVTHTAHDPHPHMRPT